jgi:hypothetical protein
MWLLAATAWGQSNIVFPAPTPGNVITATPAPATPLNPPTIQFGAGTPGTAPLGGAPTFDPYSPAGSAAQQFWGTPPSTSIPLPAGAANSPYVGQPYGFPASPTYGGPYSPYGPAVPGPAPATVPPQPLLSQNWFQLPSYQETTKFVQDLRLRHTYVAGGNADDDLGINETDLAVTFAVPGLLFQRQPLFITPGFALQLWQGPKNMSADLPANAYNAYLDFQYVTNPQLQLGAELGARVGAYTDFSTFNTHSIRVTGFGLGTLRINPKVQLKLGVDYINRNKIKLFPAGGVLWQPTPQIRLDIFFPQPKASFYLSNVNNSEVWGYLAGEYGGGAWTIQRANGTSDRIDINDIRIGAGLEFFGSRGLHGFFEGGIVVDREVVYVVTPADTFSNPTTYYLRAGVAY